MLNYWMEVTDPFRVLDEVRRHIDRAYQGPPTLRGRRSALRGWPRFRFHESGDGYELRGLVPGLDESSLKLSATASSLRMLISERAYTPMTSCRRRKRRRSSTSCQRPQRRS